MESWETGRGRCPCIRCPRPSNPWWAWRSSSTERCAPVTGTSGVEPGQQLGDGGPVARGRVRSGPSQLGGQLAATEPVRGTQEQRAPDHARLVRATQLRSALLRGRDGAGLVGTELGASEQCVQALRVRRSPIRCSSAATSAPGSASGLVNTTLPLWTYVVTSVCPSDVTTSRRSAICLLYTSDAADEEDSVDLGGS